MLDTMGKFLLLAAVAACWLRVTNGLYFYLDNKNARCFTETLDSHMLWAVQVWMPDLAEINDYREADNLEDLFIDVVITELKTNQEVLKDAFESQGSLAFTAAEEGGVYRVCFSRSTDTVSINCAMSSGQQSAQPFSCPSFLFTSICAG